MHHNGHRKGGPHRGTQGLLHHQSHLRGAEQGVGGSKGDPLELAARLVELNACGEEAAQETVAEGSFCRKPVWGD